MSQPLHLPSIPHDLITTPEALIRVCEHLKSTGRFAFDTEFIGENTYRPVLCLIQVATADRVELLDPFALSRDALAGFWDLLADPAIEKICHAGDQDVEIAWLASGHLTRNMFDTQIGAGMLGISYPTALWRAVEFFTGVILEKAHTYSAWDRRPLSKAQFAYAVDDVRYLPHVHDQMASRIAELRHETWMRAACQDMCTEAARPSDARKLFVKIRGAPGLNREQLSVLRELTALREQLAYEHDRPPRQFLKDEALLDIATRMPRKESELAAIRDIPKELIDDYGDALIDATARGLDVPEDQRPSIHVPGEDSAEVKRLAETLWIVAQVICLGQSVTPALVTSQNEVLTLARLLHRRKTLESHPLMTGWHRECLGEKLAAFVRGELQIDLGMPHAALHAAFAPKKNT